MPIKGTKGASEKYKNTCRKKTPYRSRGLARAAVSRRRRDGVTVALYHCRWCRQFHISSKIGAFADGLFKLVRIPHTGIKHGPKAEGFRVDPELQRQLRGPKYADRDWIWLPNSIMVNPVVTFSEVAVWLPDWYISTEKLDLFLDAQTAPRAGESFAEEVFAELGDQ